MIRPSRHHGRGVTLIELLAALILLSLITSGLSSWLMTVARGSHALTKRTQFHVASESLFQRITEDLTIGDLDPRKPEQALPTINGSTVTIPTRDHAIDHSGGPIRRTYAFDASEHAVTVSESPSQGTEPFRLLGNVRAMTVTWRLIDQDQPKLGYVLTITIHSMFDDRIERRWVVP